ncbi:MAG TPA: hypothetical protein P5568_12010 [Acidobacteriota bacterium]|nr:hypothetical protein [Acidobacteriota bacterium]HRV09181.1 hypothetical protein [Acidobacteriota bacterium]
MQLKFALGGGDTVFADLAGLPNGGFRDKRESTGMSRQRLAAFSSRVVGRILVIGVARYVLLACDLREP